MNIEDLRYHEEHTWVRQEEEELVIGITEYAQDQMGDIIFAELPEGGSVISAGEPFVTLESAKAVQDVIAPVSGQVTRCNEELLDVPETINEDPYGAGWMIAITPEAGFSVESLMDHAQYLALLDKLDEEA